MRKNPPFLWRHFRPKHPPLNICQDRLGTNIGERLRTKGRVLCRDGTLEKELVGGTENAILAPFYTTLVNMTSFYQDRLGTNIGKAPAKVINAFSLGDTFGSGAVFDAVPKPRQETVLACGDHLRFYTRNKNDIFTKTGSGQTQGKQHPQNQMRFNPLMQVVAKTACVLYRMRRSDLVRPNSPASWCLFRPFCPLFPVRIVRVCQDRLGTTRTERRQTRGQSRGHSSGKKRK
eukprot:COSAG06_NODE_4554_length_4150_cov_1603.846989_2_plen_232_part_00